MTKQTPIEMPKVYEAYICDSDGHYKLREFFWSKKSARNCLEEELEEYEYSRYEYEWGIIELDIKFGTDPEDIPIEDEESHDCETECCKTDVRHVTTLEDF